MKWRLASARQRGDRAQARELRKQARTVPSTDPMDPGYRRLFYCRYADDHILGFIGSKAEAEQIKAELARFLRETLALELNPDKTLITRGAPRSASSYPRQSREELGRRFLGPMAYLESKD